MLRVTVSAVVEGDRSAGGSEPGDDQPSTAQGDEIREALIDAAAQVFADQGYSGARVHSIAEQAGLTTGAIYNRFSGKSELLLEALDNSTMVLLDELVAADMGVPEILETLGAALLDDRSSRSSLMLEAFVAARREREVAERLGPRLAGERRRLAGLVDIDKQAGRIDPTADTAAVVTFCQSVALGMRLLAAIDADMPTPDAWLHLIRTLLDALAPE